MKKLSLIALIVLGIAPMAQANLLTNGNFDVADTTQTTFPWAAGWSHWAFGGWSERQTLGPAQLDPFSGPHNGNDNTGNYNGSPQLTVGGMGGNNYSGAFQLVPAVPGATYTLNVDAGAEAWWLPSTEIKLGFLDGAGNVISEIFTRPTDAIQNPPQYDKGIVYQPFSLVAMAPGNAATVKAELWFRGDVQGGGNGFFDNAVLTAVENPSISGSITLENTSGTGGTETIGFTATDGTNTYSGNVVVSDTSTSTYTAFIPSGAPAGTYSVRFKGGSFLAKTVDVAWTGSSMTGPAVTLKNGDLDQDGEVGPSDFEAVVAQFGGTGSADCDNDGEVGPSDFEIIVANFGIGDE